MPKGTLCYSTEPSSLPCDTTTGVEKGSNSSAVCSISYHCQDSLRALTCGLEGSTGNVLLCHQFLSPKHRHVCYTLACLRFRYTSGLGLWKLIMPSQRMARLPIPRPHVNSCQACFEDHANRQRNSYRKPSTFGESSKIGRCVALPCDQLPRAATPCFPPEPLLHHSPASNIGRRHRIVHEITLLLPCLPMTLHRLAHAPYPQVSVGRLELLHCHTVPYELLPAMETSADMQPIQTSHNPLRLDTSAPAWLHELPCQSVYGQPRPHVTDVANLVATRGLRSILIRGLGLISRSNLVDLPRELSWQPGHSRCPQPVPTAPAHCTAARRMGRCPSRFIRTQTDRLPACPQPRQCASCAGGLALERWPLRVRRCRRSPLSPPFP